MYGLLTYFLPAQQDGGARKLEKHSPGGQRDVSALVKLSHMGTLLQLEYGGKLTYNII